MKFLSVRDLRSRFAEVWKSLTGEREMVVTSNGRPIAVLSAVSEETLEETLKAIRQARAVRRSPSCSGRRRNPALTA